MVIDNNRVNILFTSCLLSMTIQKDFLALYVISNILPYSTQQSMSFLNPEMQGEKTQRSSAYIIWFIMVSA